MANSTANSLGRLAFTAVGTAIAGPVGGLIGGFIGGLLFGGGPDVEGPRLDDLEVSAATYGKVIPRGYGLPKITGSIIWATDIVEEKHEETQGDIFGFGGTDVITYKYYANIAVAFGEGPAAAIPRIWAGDRLILDRGVVQPGTTNDANLVAAGVPAAVLISTKIRSHLGTESQEPDPLIAAKVLEETGESDATPAHRGLVYVVLERFPLEDYGNQIPEITAEVNWGGQEEKPFRRSGDSDALELDRFVPDFYRGKAFFRSGTGLSRVRLGTMAEEFSTEETFDSNGNVPRPEHVTRKGWIWATNGQTRSVIDPDSLQVVAEIELDSAINPTHRRSTSLQVKGSVATREFVCDLREVSGVVNIVEIVDGAAGVTLEHLLVEETPGGLQDFTHTVRGAERRDSSDVWCVGEGANEDHLDLVKFEVQAVAVLDPFDEGETWPRGVIRSNYSIDASAIDASATQVNTQAAVWVGGLNAITVLVSTDVGNFWVLANGNGEVVRAVEVPRVIASAEGLSFHNSRILGTQIFFGRGDSVTGVDLHTGELILDEDGWSSGTLNGFTVYDDASDTLFNADTGSGGSDTFDRLFLRRTSNDVPLSDVAQDLCEAAGLEASELDVSELTDTVRGFVIANQVTYRQALELLATAYLFDAVESDFQIKFKKRGREVTRVLKEEELIPIGDDGETFVENRIQEVELPLKVDLTYLDVERDGDRSMQTVQRVASPDATMRSRDVVSLELPLVLTPAEAKGIAQSLMYSSWIERISQKSAADWSNIDLDPADVVQIQRSDGKILTSRIASMEIGANLEIKLETTQEQSSSYANFAITDGGRQHRTFSLLGSAESRLALMDMPLIEDGHNGERRAIQIYWAAGAAGEGDWPGGRLYYTAEGLGFSPVGTENRGMSWGVLLDAVRDTDYPWQYDEESTVEVFMQEGSLETVTELEMLRGANRAAIVDPNGEVEIIHFRDADEDAYMSGRYELSFLLRGRRGTEGFTGGHVAGSLFVLLEDEALNRQALDLALAGETRSWLFVGQGARASEVRVRRQEIEARSLRPYGPAAISADGRLHTSTDIVIEWERRTRVGGELIDNIGSVPLAEDSEEYELEILDGNEEVLRTVTGLTSRSHTYTSAQQEADGLPVYVRIFQVSAQVGRGFPSRLFKLEGATTVQFVGESIEEGQSGSGTTGFQDRVLAQQYAMPRRGNINTVDAYLGSGDGNMRVGIYEDSGGSPGALLASSLGRAVTGAQAWESFDLGATVTAEENEVIWVAVQADDSFPSRGSDGDDETTGRELVNDTYASGLPDPFGSGSSYSNTRGIRVRLEVPA